MSHSGGKIFLWIAACVALFSACKNSLQGDVNTNAPPQTFSIVDTIIRTGDDRFNSQVFINWWGDDPDGYIAGYEFTFDSLVNDQTDWRFTLNHDSVFLLPAPPGQDTVDFIFHVRAVDNEGFKDPTPAVLVYPVKNSPPVVSFVNAENNPVRSFPVLRFYWTGSDPDGTENLNHFELCWNDTTAVPYTLDVSASGAVFEAVDLQSDTSACLLYVNNNSTPQALLMPGMLLNDSNVLYIRAVDDAFEPSPYVASYKVFVKKPVSDILLVDGYTTGGATVEGFYADQLSQQGFAPVDTMQIFQQSGGSYTQLSPDNLSQSKVFGLFKTIIWFTNDASNSLSLGQKTLNGFFDAGGKLLMAVYVSSLFDEQSNFLDFTPIQSFVVPDDTTLLLTDTSGIIGLQPGYPDLESTTFVGVVRPFHPAVGAIELYSAELLAKDNVSLSISNWDGTSTVMAMKKNGSGETNFIISTLELQKLNGLSNIEDLFHQILITEFGL